MIIMIHIILNTKIAAIKINNHPIIDMIDNLITRNLQYMMKEMIIPMIITKIMAEVVIIIVIIIILVINNLIIKTLEKILKKKWILKKNMKEY